MLLLAFSKFFRRPRGLIFLAVLVNALLWILVLTVFPSHATTAILHYRIGVGIDFIGAGQQITTLPLGGSLILIMNAFLAHFLKHHEMSSAWALSFAAIMVQVILLGAFILIWQAN